MNLYWIGGTGSWSDTAHWSLESGGAGGADVPTSSDDVFIDSNSGFGSGGTITIDATEGECNDFIANSGHSYTFTSTGGAGLNVYGSLTFESGITCSVWDISFYGTTTGHTITLNGVVLTKNFELKGVGGGLTLQDDLVITGRFYSENGTFDANDHNVTANYFEFYADTGYTPTVIMGSGTWEATGDTIDVTNRPWKIDENNGEVVTVTPETSTIKFTNESEYAKAFYGGGKTYNNIWLTGAGTGEFLIYGSNTFNDFKCDTPPHTVKFEGNKTQSVSSFTLSGTLGNLITINQVGTGGAIATLEVNNGGSGWVVEDYFIVLAGDVNAIGQVTEVNEGVVTAFIILEVGSGYSVAEGVECGASGEGIGLYINILSVTVELQHTLSKSSGIVQCDYLDISNSIATGGATWRTGNHSINNGNNEGWYFRGGNVYMCGFGVS